MIDGRTDLDAKQLEEMGHRDLSRHLMGMPAKKRLKLVLDRWDSSELVAEMAEQDFYLTVKELGEEDSLPLLALARVGQLTHVFDLEWWGKDSVKPGKSLEWLERLARAGEEKLTAWLYEADFELLVSLFKKWITVSFLPEGVDLLEARDSLPGNTLDDQYYWETRYPQYEAFIKQLLSLLFEVHQGFYRELMNHILYAIDAPFEEEAYRFHKARLEEMAIPDYYDALEIYQSMREDEIIPGKEDVRRAEPGGFAPSFALALIPDGDFLRLAWKEIRDSELLDELQFELAALANKVVVADQLSLDSSETLLRAVDKAVAGVSLGLELMARDSLKAAAQLLRKVFLEHLFRLGNSQVVRLRARMEQMVKRGWVARWPAGLKCLEPEWQDAVDLLLLKTPRLLRKAPALPDSGVIRTAPPREDYFRTREDLFRGKHIVDVVLSLGPVFDALHIDMDAVRHDLWPEALIPDLEDVTLGTLILTAAARCKLSGTWEAKPLPVASWPALFAELSVQNIENAVRPWLEQVLPETGHRALVESYLAPLFEAYGAEMSAFDAGFPPDPRMVRFFLFSAR